MTRVLVVEDDPKIRATVVFQLREDGLAPEAVESAEEAWSHLEAQSPDLLLLDVRLPGMSGVDLVRRLVDVGRLPPTVIISGEASISETVEALQLGVHDFIEKPFSRERLQRSVANALEHTSLRREVAELRSELGAESEILGRSPAIEELRRRIDRAARTDARVLILGESGTGKELVADALHRGSPRRRRPFVRINCAAIPAQLAEDELFGHVRGAFTDARTDKPGLFELAHRGTLFLDEIGAMDTGLQSRLLRVLEDGRVRRLGGSREVEVDVRVISATNADLEEAVAEGTFREDLFFRLAHLPLEVPPLRAREGDVKLLFEHFLRTAERRHRMRTRRVDDAVLSRLETYPWPGNVRELRALCERLVVLGSDPLTVDQLPARFRSPETTAEEGGLLNLDPGAPILPLRTLRERVEREYLAQVLERTGGNVAEAARCLGLNRTYLHEKLVRLGLRGNNS